MTVRDPTARTLSALRPAALFDGVRSSLVSDPTVLIDGAQVVGVETGRCEVPPDVTVVELPGCTLLPGLIDTHVHLCFDGSPDPVAALDDRDDEAAIDAMVAAGRQQVRAGVTTVRDLGDRGYLAVRLRDQIGPGAGLPTIVAAGPPITTPEGHCHFLGGAVHGSDDVRAAVAEHAERGVDVIKVMASGGFMTPGSEVNRPQFELELLRAIVEAAHGHGLPVVTHAHSTAAVALAVQAGVDGIEHCTFVGESGIEAPDGLIDQIVRARIVVGSTLGMIPGMVPPPAIAAILPDILDVHRRFRERGAAQVVGSDAGIGVPKPHGVLPHAFAQLADLGWSPAEALRTMTADAARVCGLEDSKGRVAPGFDADLLVVRGDPLADPGALLDVEAVYLDGRRMVGERS